MNNDETYASFIRIAFLDEEVAAYQQVVTRLQRTGPLSEWGNRATGFVASLLAGVFAAEMSVVRSGDGALIAVLVYAGFMLGMWSPYLWTRREKQERWRKAFRARWSDAGLLLSSKGIATRVPGARGYYSGSAIKKVTQENGLLLVWTSADIAIPVPTRLLSPGQQAQLRSFGIRA